MFDVAIDQNILEKASELLRKEQLVAFPTETVYGLGADARSAAAIRRLYEAKGRPSTHPVIVHLHNFEQLADWASDLPSSAEVLARAFWPGPMTLVLKRAAGVLDEVTGGQDTVGLRIPNHPLALALLKQFGGALVAPSANKFGRLSPTTAADVRAEFGDELAMVLDGGPCEVGIESTIIDLTAARPRILRPGMLTVAQIMTVLGDKFDDVQKSTKDDSMSVVPDADKDDVRVPGSLASHYAPVTPLYLIKSSEFKTYIDEQTKIDRNIAVVSFLAPLDGFSNRTWVTLTKNPRSFAQKIYGALRKLDKLKPRMIVVEAPPLDAGLLKAAEDDWSAINDRLKRAAFKDQASS